jgi:Fe-S-cluster containining protein
MKKNKRSRLLKEPVSGLCPPDCCECCTDWFSHLRLTKEEYDFLKEHGAKHLNFKGKTYMLEITDGRCEFLENGKCKIYNERPDVCKRFLCFNPNEKEDVRQQ